MCSAMCSVKPKQSTYVRSHRNTLVDGLGKYFLDAGSIPAVSTASLAVSPRASQCKHTATIDHHKGGFLLAAKQWPCVAFLFCEALA